MAYKAKTKRRSSSREAQRPLVVSWHTVPFDDTCEACKHERRDAMEALYLRAYRTTELARVSGIDRDRLQTHFDAVGLTDKRADNTDAFYARIIDLGLEAMTAEDAVEMLPRALERKDRLNGRDIQRIEQLRPTKIVIVAPPQTGTLVEGAVTDAEQEAKGEVIRALGPAERATGD